MIKYILGALLLTSCAAFQGQPSKVDVLAKKLECRIDLLSPYAEYLTLDNLQLALAGELDVPALLSSMNIGTGDIKEFVTGWKACDEAEKVSK
jgi:hypothetical protein